MRRIFRLGAALSILALGCIGQASVYADDFKVMRAEAISGRAADLSSADADHPARLSFQAYGRLFDFSLQSNARLLARLPPAQKRSFQQYPIYRGEMAGRPGSWVRLTRIGDGLHGAFWDGTDLYTIAPARDVAPYAIQSLDASGSDPVVYRLADTQSVLDTAFCGVGPEQTLGASASYQELVGELQQQFAIAAVALEEIEIAFVADFEFSNRFPADTEGAMLARVNVIDGIFDGQVGVALVPNFVVFTTSNDPFTSSEASTLLNEVGNYRQSTPAVRARGLAHLMTGRTLNGNTAGVAFVDSLCEAFGGVGLSQNTSSVTTSALIAAHEIGHNFGAPHDAEAGSPCESTPPTFLMNTQINGNTTFSQCSLDQIRPRVAAATCITPLSAADAALIVPGGTIAAVNGIAFDLGLDVNSAGNTQVDNVVLTAAPGASLAVDAATLPGGMCTTGANGVVTCDLGTMGVGTARRVTLRLRGTAVGATQVDVSLASSNDANAQNNAGSVAISVNASAPTQPPSGGGGGGGGGGGIGLLTLIALAALSIGRSPRRWALQ